MKNKLLLIFLAIAFMAGCGDTKSFKPQVTSGVPAASDGPTLIADQPVNKNPVKVKKPKKSVSQSSLPAPAPVVTQPIAQVQPQVQAPTVSSLPQVMTPQKPPIPYVIGMGSTGEKPADLNSQGLDFAIHKAEFCAVSHQYPGGGDCYLVYSDGKTQWANSGNFKDARAFISQLKAQRDAKKAAKKRKV